MYLFKTLQSSVNLLAETIFQLNLKFYANEVRVAHTRLYSSSVTSHSRYYNGEFVHILSRACFASETVWGVYGIVNWRSSSQMHKGLARKSPEDIQCSYLKNKLFLVLLSFESCISSKLYNQM